jgi:Short C-terminal domain
VDDSTTSMGPISHLIVEFPGGKLTGEGLAALVDLVDRGVLRVLDLRFIARDVDDTIRAIAVTDLDNDGVLDLAIFEGAASGLLDQDDLDSAGSVLATHCGATAPSSWRPDMCPKTICWQHSIGPRADRPRKEPVMPGLIRGVARTAVVAGTATAVSNRVSRRQANRWADQGDPRYGAPTYQEAPPPPPAPAPAPAPPPPAAPAVDPLDQLQKLGELKAQGILTEAEFEQQKAKILAS